VIEHQGCSSSWALFDHQVYPGSGLREPYRFRPVDQPSECGGTRSHRSGGIWAGRKTALPAQSGRVPCGHEVGRTGLCESWMCRILRPTSCPLLCPARCTSP